MSEKMPNSPETTEKVPSKDELVPIKTDKQERIMSRVRDGINNNLLHINQVLLSNQKKFGELKLKNDKESKVEAKGIERLLKSGTLEKQITVYAKAIEGLNKGHAKEAYDAFMMTLNERMDKLKEKHPFREAENQDWRTEYILGAVQELDRVESLINNTINLLTLTEKEAEGYAVEK